MEPNTRLKAVETPALEKRWMPGGQAVVESLLREGVRVIFGLPGVQIYGMITALRDDRRIRFISTRHEQATTYMADGYARASGEVGVALVVPGPGLLNASAGLATAYAASSQVLVIAGQVSIEAIGSGIGHMHEVVDQLNCIAPITKWRKRITLIGEIPSGVRSAFWELRSGRPRPVELELPPETMEDYGVVLLLDPLFGSRPAVRDSVLDEAARILGAAKRVAIYAGGGVNLGAANSQLRGLADYLQAGVVASPEGKGALDDRDDLSLGAALWEGSPLRAYLDSADVVLVVGSRMMLTAMAPHKDVIQIDLDPNVIGVRHKQTLGLVGDAADTLSSLLDRLRLLISPRPSRASEHRTVKAAVAALDTFEPQSAIMRSLRAALPDDAILVAGMTQMGYYTRPYWPVFLPRTYLTSSYAGALGYEIPTALGAKVAKPDQAVVALVGDGGFLYNAQELATAVQERINVIAVVFNDGSYGNVARDLDEERGGTFGTTLRNPDFMKLAEAFGVAGFRSSNAADIGKIVRHALTLEEPVLIEVPVGRMPRTPMIPSLRRPLRRPGDHHTGEDL